MNRYLNTFLEYLPVFTGAAAAGAVLLSGAGTDIADAIKVQTDLGYMTIDVVTSQAALFGVGGTTAVARNAIRGDYSQRVSRQENYS